MITSVRNSLETNTGLSTSVAPTGLTSFANNLTPVTVPTFQIPRTTAQNYALSTSNAIRITNPNLKIPYVGQYSLNNPAGIQGDDSLRQLPVRLERWRNIIRPTA